MAPYPERTLAAAHTTEFRKDGFAPFEGRNGFALFTRHC